MAWSESCTKMKSATADLHSLYSSDENICAATYTPTLSLMQKTQTPSSPAPSPFELQKVQLSPSSLLQKTSSLLNQTIVIYLDNTCTPLSATDLSAKAQRNLKDKSMSKQASLFLIEDSWTLSDLEQMAEEDPCVLGITSPGTLYTAHLALPTTNDPQLSQQTHLSFINFQHAYTYLVQKQSSAFTTKVALIDAGIDCAHSDLKDHLPPQCGRNILDPFSFPSDEQEGHGTHVAGILGATVNNGVGITGLSGNSVQLLPIKVIGPDGGSVQDAYDGIQWAISQHVDIINLSTQSTARLPSIEQAVSDAVNAGIVVVMAAGNYGLELGKDSLISPAMVGTSLQGAITVGSVDTNTGQLSRFSNFGNQVEIATAGAISSFSSSYAGGLFSLAPGSQYQRMMGTSQATPIVSAAAALVIQFLKQNRVPYTPADIERIITSSADYVPMIPIQNGRVLNFSKLVRNTYSFANIPLCP